MALVESLLTAIMRADGDALVMHVGEKPYVVASAGPIELSTQGLNLQAMAGMTAQLLPPESQRALTEFGAVEHEIPTRPIMQGDRFTVVVARGGDDVWIELRRHRRPVAVAPPVEMPAEVVADTAVPAAALEYATVESSDIAREVPAPDSAALEVLPPAAVAMVEEAPSQLEQSAPHIQQTAPEVTYDEAPTISEPTPVVDEVVAAPIPAVEVTAAAESSPAAAVVSAETPWTDDFSEQPPVSDYGVSEPLPAVEWTPEPAPQVDVVAIAATPIDAYATEPVAQPVASIAAEIEPEVPEIEEEVTAAEPATFAASSAAGPVSSFTTAAAVIPMTRTVRIEVPPTTPPRKTPPPSEVERLLALAASRAATALYLTTQTSPYIRIDADVRMLEGEPPLSAADIEAAVLQLVPEESRDVVGRGEAFEWTSELADIGPIRCSTFRDHRGPGAIFQFISMRPMAAEQLGIAAEIQALTSESDGLVLVSSARGNGKSTIIGSLIDLINRQRPTYIITFERQIRVVHEPRQALISQREVRGTSAELLTMARAALRENPDVLVIEDLVSADMFQLALDAAGTGVLVFVSVTAASTTAALTRLVELFPAERRRGTQALIAERLRGSVTQALLRKTGGGRIAAREVVLTTSAITTVLADGQVSDLPSAIESGRKHGLVSLTDALVQLVREGAIDLREAYRKADDRAALLAAMKRENLDTSQLERLA